MGCPVTADVLVIVFLEVGVWENRAGDRVRPSDEVQ